MSLNQQERAGGVSEALNSLKKGWILMVGGGSAGKSLIMGKFYDFWVC